MSPHHTLALLAVLAPLATSGCGPGTSNSALNPASNVDVTFSTFTLKKQSELPETLFWDFYRGAEPADGEPGEARDWADALRRVVDLYAGTGPTTDGTRYQTVRNPYDLINEVIAANAIRNFYDGRRYISERIDLGQASTYNSRSNGAVIRFKDQSAEKNGAALADREWRYPTLGWIYTPGSGSSANKVFRTVQYIAGTAPADETATPPELQSLLVGGQYEPTQFAIDGYNHPELVEASFTARHADVGRMSLSQDFITDKRDTLFISQNQRIDVNGQTPDCVRAVLDYSMQTLSLYLSENEPATVPDDSTANPADTRDNPDYCGNKQTADKVFNTIAIGTRQ